MNEQILSSRPTFPAQLDYSHPLTKGLVGAWVMNDTGMRAWDSSPYKNHGISTSVKGGWDGKLFDGTASIIDCGGDGRLNPGTGSFTMCVWQKTTSTNKFWGRRYAGVSPDWGIGDDTGAAYLLWRDSGAGIGTVTGTGSVCDGKIHFVAGVRDTAKALAIVYKDGTQNGSAADTSVDVTSAGQFHIGASRDSESLITGTIYLVTLHNRALNAFEIKSFYLHPYDMFLK